MTRYRTTDGQEDLKERMDYFNLMAIPVAFMNGIFLGAYGLRKIRQYWEGGPMDWKIAKKW